MTLDNTTHSAPIVHPWEEEELPERMEWVICGRVAGTATGWDQSDTFAITIYDFEPAPGVNIPATECLNIDYESGKIEVYGGDTWIELVWTGDLIEALGAAAKKVDEIIS